jgi:flagellin-like hook-associated protein FlgL
MSLVINHNLMAMNAARSLNISYGRLATSVQRLSSGLRINSAMDDAAGLAVREMMRTDITVLNQGVRNANDAISMIQTADGALSVIDEKLTRMKELAEQAATGTYTTAQRLIMDSEFQAMASEITRIANATDFNGVKLLDGSLSGTGLDGTSGNQMKIHFGTGNSSAEDYYYVKINGATASALGIGGGGGSGTPNEVIQAYLQAHPIYSTTFATANVNFFVTELGPGVLPSFLTDPTEFDQNAPDLACYGYPPSGGPFHYVDFFQNLKDGSIYVLHTEQNGGTYTYEGFEKAEAGGNIKTQANAQQALEKLDSAIVAKDNIRANLGATANRLANTVSNLSIQAENLQAAESRISDADVATEMTEFTRNQVLVQAGVAMLAQANSLPQLALRLLQG